MTGVSGDQTLSLLMKHPSKALVWMGKFRNWEKGKEHERFVPCFVTGVAGDIGERNKKGVCLVISYRHDVCLVG